MENSPPEELRPQTAQDPYSVKLEVFEGPLDLLLYLIKREEINIYDIPIARITDQYLRYLELMKDLNIDLAAEFLVLAATLIYIKSKMLLPAEPKPTTEDGLPEEDPRKELVEQLLEHQRFKEAAQMLYERETVESATWSQPHSEVLDEEKGLISVTVFDLIAAFRDVVKRFEERALLQVQADEVSLEEKIAELRALLLLHRSLKFSTFFERAPSRAHLVVTFLALLELARLRELRMIQEQLFGEIIIQSRV
ncbi:MAG: segregation/condensation protein A [Acidobacteria bacterium]|nr:segregation/condensation protein A [Acidobacteriota bacterium]